MAEQKFFGGTFDMPGPALWTQQITKTAAYTILPSDNGALFDNSGATAAVTFTLPAIKRGYCFGFVVYADQSVTVASAAGDDMVVPNDASADSVAFSTAGDKIGGYVMVFADASGSKWIVVKMCSNAMTIAT